MPQIDPQVINQHDTGAHGSIQVVGAYGGPPGRFSAKQLKISAHQFPASMGHQHNASRKNTFAALTFRDASSYQRLCCIKSQESQCQPSHSAAKTDKPIGFEVFFGQALEKSAEVKAITLSDISGVPGEILATDKGADIVEFELEVIEGAVEAVIPEKQVRVGQKAPFAELVNSGASQKIKAPCRVLGVVVGSRANAKLRARFDPYQLHQGEGTAAQSILRAVVVDACGQFCGELLAISKISGQLKIARPAEALLITPSDKEVNECWAEKGRALLNKAGDPVEKRPGKNENINDVDIPAMTDTTKAKLLGLLACVTDAFHRLDVPYVLSGGSELGKARNNDVIKWDDDIDIVVPMHHLGKMLAHRDDFKAMGVLITPRYHGVKFSFLDDKQREKDGTPYPFVDIFAMEKNSHGEWEFEDVAGCKLKFPFQQMPANVFERAVDTQFGPLHLGLLIKTMAPDTSLLYLNRTYGTDGRWDKDRNILNRAFTHTYDHDTGASKEPEPLNATQFEPGSSPDALWPLESRALVKPLSEHHKYVPELMQHLHAHQDRWQLDDHVLESWPEWVASLPVASDDFADRQGESIAG